jgi:hypothetical protein
VYDAAGERIRPSGSAKFAIFPERFALDVDIGAFKGSDRANAAISGSPLRAPLGPCSHPVKRPSDTPSDQHFCATTGVVCCCGRRARNRLRANTALTRVDQVD